MLTKILEFRYSESDLISATHVCEIWRSALLSTPLLWTEVEFGNSDRASTYLERSKSTPLHVSVGYSAIDSESFAGDMSWFGRIDSLRILACRDQIESIAGELCLPTPNLRSLTIDGRSGGGLIHIPPEFLGRRAPFLRNLTLDSVSPMPVTNLPLQNLTNLRWVDLFSFVGIEEVLVLLTLTPLLEALDLGLRVQSTTEAGQHRGITLTNLRRLAWANYGGPLSLMSLLVAPELKHATIHVTSDSSHSDLSTILPLHRNRFPWFAEPIALRYRYRNFTRSCHITYPSGYIEIHQTHMVNRHPPDDRWLSTNASISFRKTKHLCVEAYGGCPSPGDIPMEQFESLESLELMGEVGELLSVVRSNGSVTSGIPSIPFPSLSELHLIIRGGDFPFEALAGVLKERKEAGYRIKALRIKGRCKGYSEAVTWELAKLVDSVTKIG